MHQTATPSPLSLGPMAQHWLAPRLAFRISYRTTHGATRQSDAPGAGLFSSAATSLTSAAVASRWSAGMLDKLIAGLEDMRGTYLPRTGRTLEISRLIHSAAVGGRPSSALTRRRSRSENGASNRAWFSDIILSLIAGQVKVHCSRRL